jgi:superfamily I DNA/RNA helicase
VPVLSFTPRFSRAVKQSGTDIEREVWALVEQFMANSRSAALDLEAYQGALDPKFRTIRLTRGLRALAWALADDLYVLDDIATHDEATRLARRRRCDINPFSGALRICEFSIETDVAAPEQAAVPTLFAQHRFRELIRAGISEPVASVLKCLRTREDFDQLVKFGPRTDLELADALLTGFSADEAKEYVQLCHASRPSTGTPDGDDRRVAPDLRTAVDAAARNGELVVISTERELKDALRLSFAEWTVFLHPSQRDHAYRPRFNGPFVLLGGPGTGKTVVALHRAYFLAKQLAQGSMFETRADKPILFCAFSASLVQSIREQVTQLGGEALAGLIDVATVDAVASRILKDHGQPATRIISGDELADRAGAAIAELPQRASDGWLTPGFLLDEWEHFILGNLVTSADEYLASRRMGAGRGLRVDQRRMVWDAVQNFERGIQHDNATTFPHNALRATMLAGDVAASRYAHIIVDEAQDLSTAHWRLLRALVPEGPNDLFIVGDAHQRIYTRGAPLKAAGIRTPGRKRTLVLNYRNTVEIIDWALQLLTGTEADDLDEGMANLEGYHGRVNGPKPVCIGYETKAAELVGIAEAVREWVREGIEPASIAVMCRSNKLCDDVAKGLADAGVPTHRIRARTDRTKNGMVSVLTMHRSKGLEFRATAVAMVCAGIMPQASTLAEAGDDTEERKRLERTERKLLFTACTRPRERLRVSWHAAPSPFLVLPAVPAFTDDTR